MRMERRYNRNPENWRTLPGRVEGRRGGNLDKLPKNSYFLINFKGLRGFFDE